MKYYIYILFSKKLNRYYVGTTDDVEKRLLEHNSRTYKDSFTSRGLPWELKLAFEVDDSTLAYKLEAFIKRMKSKKFIEKVILDTTILEDIIQTKL